MKLFIITALALYTTVGFSQNCNYYFFQNNKTIKMGVYNKKSSSDGNIVYKISGVEKSGGTTTAHITSEFFDRKNKSYGQSAGRMQCKGGMLLIDITTLLSPQQNSEFQKAEATGQGFYLEYPSKLKAGDVLKDGSLNMDVKMESGINAAVKMEITNRVVQAKETITTPAGTWEAFRISYNSKTVIDMGIAIPMRLEITEWFVPDFGVVKTEHKMGKTELLSIQ